MKGTKLPLRRTHTGDRLADQMQRSAQQTTQQLAQIPFIPGRRINGVEFSAGVAKTIDHGFGRRVQGYIVLRSYGANHVQPGEATTQPPDPTRQINLVTSANATLDLWVF